MGLIKRIPRELKKNFLRYFALFLLITLSMYLITSLVGAAETIITRNNEASKRNLTEDGEFAVFVPLSKKNISDLKNKGVIVEEMFYLDFNLKNGSKIRVFKNRENVNLNEADKGSTSKNNKEILLEKIYASSNGLSIGDDFEISNIKFKVSGIGSSPDYDNVIENITDVGANSKKFGTAFVTSEAYDLLKKSGKASSSEEYLYSFRTDGSMNNEDLKDYISKLEYDKSQINDKYMLDIINKIESEKNQLLNGVKDLKSGGDDLSSGLAKLNKNSDSLISAINSIITETLKGATYKLNSAEINVNLTEKNYNEVLSNIIKTYSEINPSIEAEISPIKQQLDGYVKFRSGINEYTKGVGFASKGAKKLQGGLLELQDKTTEITNELFSYDIDNLTFFLESKDNPRIAAAADDVLVNKITGIYAGIIVLVLLAYVISVFVVHSIDEESKVIGALYSLGVSKKTLILHYLMLPIIISFIGGMVGVLIGFSDMGISMQTLDTSGYYSFPELTNVYPLYLIAYGSFAPPFIAVIVNLLVINKKLTKSPLKLLRKERGGNKISKVKLFNMGFINCFRIRQLLREKRSGFAIGAGMFISLLIVMLGLNSYVSISNMKENNEKDIKFQYMYTLKYPDKVVPDKGEACYIKSLNRENLGYDIEVSILGIDDNNPYLDFTPTKGKRNLTVSTSVATKFKLSVGEKVIFTDKVNNKDYSFTVDKIVPYSVGLYAFMDINSMRDVFGQEKDYYNTLLASESLSIDPGRIYATTSKDDLLEVSNIFMNMMKPMIVTLIVVSTIIFIVVLYLMMKVMIDRSKFNIALMKIFGFNNREIRKLYLDSNLFIVVVSAIVCIPLSKLIINNIWPILISNVAMGFNSTFPIWMYLSLFALVMVSYMVINFLLTYKLKKVTTSEVLKSQE